MSWHRDFFVGWAGRLPVDHAAWVRSAVATTTACFLFAGLLLSRAQDDPGGGTGAATEVTLDGVLAALPYPTLTMHAAGGEAGHTILLSGAGKTGPEFDVALDGHTVRVTGYMLSRGALEMLQVTEKPRRADADLPAAPAEDLGRWRITGEICDGKCLAGAMRPGSGIVHRACANLCVTGSVPPVFVATGPVEGRTHMLLADPGGGPLGERFRNLTALHVTLEGIVEQRGSLLIFKPELAQAHVW
jgi:hypothetical protein